MIPAAHWGEVVRPWACCSDLWRWRKGGHICVIRACSAQKRVADNTIVTSHAVSAPTHWEEGGGGGSSASNSMDARIYFLVYRFAGLGDIEIPVTAELLTARSPVPAQSQSNLLRINSWSADLIRKSCGARLRHAPCSIWLCHGLWLWLQGWL